ncbi:MAG: hypothetical protein DBX55_07100 [Verrucomicrobia bacterium]|nr:MAG: hypothetical protein DBX55_07100 [Verrucomicrobiota bacterium]
MSYCAFAHAFCPFGGVRGQRRLPGLRRAATLGMRGRNFGRNLVRKAAGRARAAVGKQKRPRGKAAAAFEIGFS